MKSSFFVLFPFLHPLSKGVYSLDKLNSATVMELSVESEASLHLRERCTYYMLLNSAAVLEFQYNGRYVSNCRMILNDV